MDTKNICIGKGAGNHLTDQDYQLCLKCPELDIDFVETMNEREYELISKVTKVMYYYYKREKRKTHPIFHGGCSACRTGDCSIHIGYEAGIVYDARTNTVKNFRR